MILAWETLCDFFDCSTLHNRVTMTLRLHDFKMESGTSITAKHLDAFDDMIAGRQTAEEPVDESRQLSILLCSLSSKNKLISSIVKNVNDITLIKVKEKL